MAGNFIRVGRIVGAFGLKGELKVDLLTDFAERFDPGSRLRLKGDWVTVDSVREHKGRLLLKLNGVDDATAAEALQWEYLEGAEDERPELDDDEYLIDDLIGLTVVLTTGGTLGKVDEVLAYPAQDILKVGDLLIPMVDEFVRDVDLEERQITVQLIPGMLPGDEETLA